MLLLVVGGDERERQHQTQCHKHVRLVQTLSFLPGISNFSNE